MRYSVVAGVGGVCRSCRVLGDDVRRAEKECEQHDYYVDCGDCEYRCELRIDFADWALGCGYRNGSGAYCAGNRANVGRETVFGYQSAFVFVYYEQPLNFVASRFGRVWLEYLYRICGCFGFVCHREF